MYTKNNIAVISYNGVGVSFSDFKRGWNYFKSGNHFYISNPLEREAEVWDLIQSFDRRIDHVIIYAGSLRKLYWVKFAVVNFSKIFPGCTFTIFSCDCANQEKVDEAINYLQIDKSGYQHSDHIMGNAIAQWINMYWSYGIEIFNFKTLDEFYQDYRAKNL